MSVLSEEKDEERSMRVRATFSAFKLALGGAILAISIVNVAASAWGAHDPGIAADLISGGIGGVASFAVLAKAAHLLG